jgi:fibronectin-binding autotransporter adhesin
VVISVPSGGGAGDGVNIIAAGTQTANTTGTVLFGNANGISFGMSNNSVVTASYTTPPAQTVQPVAMSGSNGSFNFSTATFGNSNGMLFYTTNGSMVGSYTVPSIAGLISAINVSGGATSNNLSAITFNNSNGVSFGLTGSVMTATVKTDYQSSNANYLTSQSNQAISGSNGSFAFQTATFGNSNGLSFYTTNGSMVGSYTVNGYNIVQAGTIGTTGTTWSSLSASVYLNGSGAMTVSQNNSNQIVLSVPPVSSLSATGIVSISTNGSTISIGASVPALSVWEPFPLVTGSAFSSHTPGSWWVNRFVIGNNLTMSNFQVILSLNASVPAATSAASTGTAMYSYTRGLTLLKRQDYGANSTNLTTVATASFGLTAGLSYSSTSQSFVMSWVTNSTGGTSSYNTTSNAGGWSSFLTGPKMISIPCITSLGQGEYFLAHNHSSTTGTTNSNVTLMSVSALHIAPQLVTIGLLGGSSTLASFGINGIGNGIASAMTTNAAMPGSVISVGTNNMIYVNMSNA